MNRILISILLTACGPDPRVGDDRPPGSTRAPLVEAHLAPERASNDGVAAANLVVQSVFGASILDGGTRLVTSGTLNGSTRQWSPEPSDRLVVELSGKRYEIFVTSMSGDFSSPTAFFDRNHVLKASVRTQGADIALESQRTGDRKIGTARGSITVEEVVYTFDLRSDGTDYFENDSTGSEYREAHRLTGSVVWNESRLDVDEGWEFSMVTTTGQGGGSASSAVRTIGSQLAAGGNTYRWEGVRLAKAFTDGKPGDQDFWNAAGRVTRDGQEYGMYRLDGTVVGRQGGFLKFVLVLPDQTIEVESWNAY